VFTGLIECKGIITRVERTAGGLRLEVYAPEFGRDMAIGDSIAVDGACLTVTKFIRGAFLTDVSSETVSVSTLGDLRQGAHVNLERSLRFSDRLGGHLVTGHVDGVGHIVNRRPAGNSIVYQFRAPESVQPLLIRKGSVAIDGISLTVADLLADGFTTVLIPHTEDSTTLKDKPVSAPVNMEADMLAKYVRRFTTAYGGPPPPPADPRSGTDSQKRGLGDMLRDLTEGR
jgi:riboflavin synthase